MRAASLLLTGVGLATASQGQERPLLEPPAFALRQWTASDGLPQNSVTALAQTDDGYLWVGTFGGLARFDGTSFRVIERTDSAGAHTDRVLALAVAADGTIWVGTERGLFAVRDGRFVPMEALRPLEDAVVNALLVDRDATLWIGTSRHGLFRRTGEAIVPVLDAAGARVPSVAQLGLDASGRLWVAHGDESLVVLPGTPPVVRRAATVRRGAQRLLLVDREGGEWFQQADGMVRVHAGQVQRFRREAGFPLRSAVAEDGRGGYWFGTGGDGAIHYRPDRAPRAVTPYPLARGTSQYRVRATFVDREGNTWIGTDADGLLLARRKLFTTYTAAHGLSHDVVTAVIGAADGTIWAGTNCGGVNVLDLRRRTVRLLKPRRPGDPDGDPCIFSLARSDPDTVWTGSWGGGISRIVSGRRVDWLRSLPLPDSVVLALLADRGALWIGTNGAGVLAFEGDRLTRRISTAEGLPHNSVRALVRTRDGALWIGTLGGLSRLADGRLRTFGAADGLAALHVRALHEDAAGDLWVGTYGGGIHRLRDGRLVAIREADGLPENAVSSILEDRQGRFWLSGNRGVTRVSREELSAVADGRSTRVQAVLYGTDDGLEEAETNGGFQPSAWADDSGRFWYPTVRGVAMVDPSRTEAEVGAPPVSVEQVVVDGQRRAVTAGKRVGPGPTNLEFRYVGRSLGAARHVRYRYRLDGFDPDWVEAGARTVAYYPRLGPGRYRFRVVAADRAGTWGATEATLDLRVTGPIWRETWFRLVALAVLVAMVAAEFARRTRAARRAREAREEVSRQLIAGQEHERRRVAGELHDGLSQELLVIKNRALLALGRGDDAAAMRAQLEEISEVAGKSLESVRGLAHQLTPYLVDHLGLSEALRTMVRATATGAGLEVETEIAEIDGDLATEAQIHCFRIVQEAVNNVVHHAQATRIVVQARKAGGLVVVTVRDDGRGFAVVRDVAGRPTGGFGVAGFVERARILGGELEVISAAGQGTVVELIVPTSPPAGASR